MKEPFYEAEVQHYLAAYLEEQGYLVRQDIEVRNGRVDILARRDGQELCIEAKGEDRGGYTSAEMNLQMGFGQVLSRMNKPDWQYGYALPNTPDFRRALMKYCGGFGLGRLGWTFYLVSRSGNVSEYNASAFQRFIDRLAAGVR